MSEMNNTLNYSIGTTKIELPPLEPKSIKSASRNISRNAQDSTRNSFEFQGNRREFLRKRYFSKPVSYERSAERENKSVNPKLKLDLTSALKMERKQKDNIYRETPKIIKAFMTPKKLIEAVKREVDAQSRIETTIATSRFTTRDNVLTEALNKRGIMIFEANTHRRHESVASPSRHRRENSEQVKVQIEALDNIFHNLAYL